MFIYEINPNIIYNETNNILYNILYQTKLKIKKLCENDETWDKDSIKLEFSYFTKKILNNNKNYISYVNSSNAYYKCWEMLNWLYQNNLINFNKIIIFDNGALPGDFILACESFFNKIKKDFDWYANSYIHGLNDRYGIYECNKNKFTMNSKYNGDITIGENRDFILSKVKNKKINFYLSDVCGKFNDRMNEEKEFFILLKSSIELGLKILEKHGLFICKLFTFLNNNTKILLSQLIRCFDKSFFIKPKMSKPDNSEIYICCVDYIYNIDYSDNNIIDFLFIQNILINNQCNKIIENIENYKKNKRKYYDKNEIYEWANNINLNSAIYLNPFRTKKVYMDKI